MPGYPSALTVRSRPSAALLWQDGAVYDLNTLIAPDDPLKPYALLLPGSGINLHGQIAVTGQDSRIPGNPFITFLLTPVN